MSNPDMTDVLDIEEKIERLEEEARERWGEHRWTIKTLRFTDGTERCFAFQNQGWEETSEGEVLKRERIEVLDDGRITSDIGYVERSGTISALDRERIPESYRR